VKVIAEPVIEVYKTSFASGQIRSENRMNPRLETSKKWTPLPAELCGQIKEVFAESFDQAARAGKMHVEGRIYPNELILRVGYSEKGRLTQANFEISLDFIASKQNALEQIHVAIDCAASMMQEYFDREQDISEFPRIWQELQFGDRKVFVQLTTDNTELEAEANRLLGLEDDSLVKIDDEDTELAENERAVISMLGLDKDDGDDIHVGENIGEETDEPHVHGPDCDHDTDEDKPTSKKKPRKLH
jgi:hypothetical protein